MAAVHGKDTYFLWNAVNLSPFATEVSFPQEAETAETATFGDSWKEYVVGLKDATISASGVWSGTAAEVDATLGGALGTSASFEFRGNSAAVGAGNPKYTGTAILTSYEVTGGIGDAVSWSAEWQVSGAVTRATS